MRTHEDGDFPFANDFNSVASALDGDGVDEGCNPSSTGGMSVAVASGVVRVGGEPVDVSSDTVSLASSDPENDRYDLVVADDTGSLSSITGTASSSPKAPALPGDRVPIAIADVRADSSAPENVFDVRTITGGVDAIAGETALKFRFVGL